HHHCVPLSIRLGDNGQELSWPRLRQSEGEAHNTLDTAAREHGDVGGRFQRRALVNASSDARVLSLRVFAYDYPVELLVLHTAQRAGDAGQDAGRPDVGVLIEGLADGEPETPERDVVGDLGVTG